MVHIAVIAIACDLFKATGKSMSVVKNYGHRRSRLCSLTLLKISSNSKGFKVMHPSSLTSQSRASWAASGPSWSMICAHRL